jgi:hypothetical protein
MAEKTNLRQRERYQKLYCNRPSSRPHRELLVRVLKYGEIGENVIQKLVFICSQKETNLNS